MQEHTIFISYSHRDRPQVVPLASYFARLGLKVWMDTKDLVGAEPIIQAVSEAIAKADLYVVCVSRAALESQWVLNELNTALTLETTRGRPKVLPVLVEKIEPPPTLVARLYVDISQSLDEAKAKLKQSVEHYLGATALVGVPVEEAGQQVLVSSVRFRLTDETVKSFGGLMNEFSATEIEKEAAECLKRLRARANGILLNFISASEIDLDSPYFRFPNGNVEEWKEDVRGEMNGTIKKQVLVDVDVLNPEDKRLNDFLSAMKGARGLTRLSYSFVLSPAIAELPKRVLARLQENYLIHSWLPDDGYEIELDDWRAWVRCSEEALTIAIASNYGGQLYNPAAFSAREFVGWLLAEAR